MDETGKCTNKETKRNIFTETKNRRMSMSKLPGGIKNREETMNKNEIRREDKVGISVLLVSLN